MNALSGIERQARLKLDQLEAAMALKDPAVLPSNRLRRCREIARANTAYA